MEILDDTPIVEFFIEMDHAINSSFMDVEIKQELLSSDSEFEYQFALDDAEYDSVIKELRENDSDLEVLGLTEDAERFPCEVCKKTFARKYNLSRHALSHEMTMERLCSVCHICGKSIRGNISLHLRTHSNDKPFKCNDCGRQFRQKIGLTTHQMIHTGIKPFACEQCPRSFRQKQSLQTHVTSRHLLIKDFICDLCGKEFSEKASLQKHNLIHSTIKPYQCSVCFMSFRHKSSLSRHNKIHKKVTQCQYCGRSFRYESFLKKHLQSTHKGAEIGDSYQQLIITDGYQISEDQFIKTSPQHDFENSSSVIKFETVESSRQGSLPRIVHAETSNYYTPHTIVINPIQTVNYHS